MRLGLRVMQRLANKCRETVAPFVEKYEGVGVCGRGRREVIGTAQAAMVEALIFPQSGEGEETGVSAAYATLRDCQALVAVCALLQVQLASLQPASAALQNQEMTAAVSELQKEVKRQQAWAMTKVKAKSAQTLVVPVVPEAR